MLGEKTVKGRLNGFVDVTAVNGALHQSCSFSTVAGEERRVSFDFCLCEILQGGDKGGFLRLGIGVSIEYRIRCTRTEDMNSHFPSIDPILVSVKHRIRLFS